MFERRRNLVAEMPVVVVVEDGLSVPSGAGGIAGLQHEGGDDSEGVRGRISVLIASGEAVSECSTCGRGGRQSSLDLLVLKSWCRFWARVGRKVRW